MNIFGATTESTAAAILEPTSIDLLALTPEASPSSYAQIGNNSSSISSVSQSQKENKKQNFVPLLFISSGGLFLITPLIISKIKSNKKNDQKNY